MNKMTEARKIFHKSLAILSVIAISLCLFIGCQGKNNSPSPSFSTAAPVSNVPETMLPATALPLTPSPETPVPESPSPAVTETPVPESICGVFEMSFSRPDDEIMSFRLELLETEGLLAVRVIAVYPYGAVPMPPHTALLEKDGSRFSAAYDGEYEHITVAGTAEKVLLEYEVNGEHDPCSGVYLPAAESVPEPLPVPAPETDPLSPDGKIEKHISKAARYCLELGTDDVLTEELCKTVYELDLFETEVASLQGIEYFTNLRSISITGGYIQDLSSLASLPALQEISVSYLPVEEIPDFSGCENLTCLQITCCAVSDLSPAAKLPMLTHLNLCDNRITSVAPIKDLKNLQRLDLSFNPVLDWDSVQNNPSLILALPWDYQMALEVQKKAQKIVGETVKPGMTDLEKQVALCKALQDLAEYETVRRPQEPDGYEVLINGKGVCGDWSQAVSLLLNTAGLHVIGCGSDTHEWNMIELDGKWYEFDCLWDDGCDPANWSYCNLSHADMSKISDHKLFYPLRYPPADHTMMTLKLLFR